MYKNLLTKSKFTAAYDCPRKLFYLNNKEYGNNMLDDAFLKALAQGGYQVGALAQQYFDQGVLVESLDPATALRQTAELLKREEVVIFEGAFQFDNLWVRADIVRKKGKFLELIEVKAKSTNSALEFRIWDKNGLKKGKYILLAKYEGKVVDLAFQTHVLQKALPQFVVRSFLMLADTNKPATVDGLNQHFKIVRDERGRDGIRITGQIPPAVLGKEILERIDLTDEIRHVFNDVQFALGPTFFELVAKLAELARSGAAGPAEQGASCKGCQFRVEETAQLHSGFDRCWSERGVKPADLKNRPFVFDIWNFRGSAKLLEAGLTFADQLSGEDLKVAARKTGGGLSNSERQHIQVEFYQTLRQGEYFNAVEFANELGSLAYPRHFIDFETSTMAIPFHKGRRPYEQMAFQFSHHVLHKDGRLEHRTEYLDSRIGVFPNFDFVRNLRRALAGDNGAVLRFATHENTVLNQIRVQLLDSAEPDREQLVLWIESLTTPPGALEGQWEPTRQFVDMCELTKRYYYLPATEGSNSIKAILPAVLSHAGAYMQQKFPDWVKLDNAGGVLDPYSLLPPLFQDWTAEQLTKVDLFFAEDDRLKDGGGAMMAWARMQFTEMSALERQALCAGLKRYCGLDTLAMVMIWEWWQHVIAQDRARVA